ncbi:MAG: UDP-N-acetylmuramoyl-L-alanyl-D-glutamate--2,6-diaminopimelate ligase [Longimicrobiales bacterium]|nr:UDP-N-acetylmuramoyl-L-alanyl-D-glutamate--2,6-diaminopimelate ligase [Longimicrobiales bacterium]
MNEPAVALSAVSDVLRSADLLLAEQGQEDVSVRGVAQDSRRVRPGDLFLAWEGTTTDAHDFVDDAVARGAVAVVVEHPVPAPVPQLVVSDGRKAGALAAHRVMDSPSHELLTVGVTGTNGKTTTAHLVRHILSAEMPTAVIGTLGLVEEGGVRPGSEGLTTPGPVQIAVWLRELADGGTKAVVLEASSHALAQARLDGIDFDVAIFTNLTQDHLDYHADMGDYLHAKAHLVELVAPDGTVVVNADEPAWRSLRPGSRTLRTFSVEDGATAAGSASVDASGPDGARGAARADVRATDVVLDAHGASFTIRADGREAAVRIPLVGRYNVENALAAATAALAVGIPFSRIAERLGDAPPVPGRLEPVVSEPFSVLIDFAHTPAALEGALGAVRPLTDGRLIVVFGAGGDRDPTKRAPMARVAAKLADLVILTSDNPRTEDPESIIDDLAAAIVGPSYLRHADRREAIRMALDAARPGDTVLLAGKGHERYQVVGAEKRPFDERGIVQALLSEGGGS